MLNLDYIAQALAITLGLFLIVKLLYLRLHLVYRLFSLYLFVDLLGSVVWLVERLIAAHYPSFQLDYRLIYVAQRSVACVLIILTVYALLEAVLRTLPGILSFSRHFLNLIFVIAALVGLTSAAWEYHNSDYSGNKAWQDTVLLEGLLAERVVFTIILLVIVGILLFLLWFPLLIPRNLAVFTVGFVVYSAGASTSLLVQSLLLHETSRAVSIANDLLLAGCLAGWGVFITKAGENAPTRLNIRRDPREQDRLIRSLELLNESLLQS